jgi:hypothetical protein
VSRAGSLPDGWPGAEKAYPAVAAEGGAAWRRFGADGEAECRYSGDKRVAWLIGFYGARTKGRVKCMNEGGSLR